MSLFNSAELEKSISKSISELDDADADVDITKDELEKLRGQIKLLNDQHKKVSEGMENVEQNPVFEEKVKEILRKEMEESFVSMEVFKEQVEEKERLENQVEELEDRIETLNEGVKYVSVEEDFDTEELNEEVEKARFAHKVDKAELEDEITIIEEEAEEMRAALDNKIQKVWSEEKDDVRELEKKFEELLEKMNEEHPAIREEIDNIREDRSEDLEVITGLKTEIQDVREMASSIAVEEKVDRTHFENEIELIQEQLGEGYPELEKRINNLKVEEKVDKSQLEEEVEDVVERLEQTVAEAKTDIEESTPNKSEIGSLWASLEMLEDKIEFIESNVPDQEEFDEGMETVKSRSQSIENEVTAVQKSVENMQQKNYVEEKSFSKGIDEFRKEINEDVKELADKISSRYATSNEVSGLWSVLEALEDRQNEIKSTVSKIDELDIDELGRLKDTLKYLEYKVSDLEELEGAVNTFNQLQGRVEDLEIIIEGMDAENVDQQEFDELMQDVRELSEFVKELHLKVD